MTTESLWQRYAATWSLAAADRARELPACVVGDVAYCDPNGLVEGWRALSDYMGIFHRRHIHGRSRPQRPLHAIPAGRPVPRDRPQPADRIRAPDLRRNS
jgi:hypothetical protein